MVIESVLWIFHMKTYLIANLVLVPFVLVSYTIRNSLVLSSVILTIGFAFAVLYLYKNTNNK